LSLITASNVTVPKYFLSEDGDSGTEDFFGVGTLTGDDGGQKPLSSARHMVPMANATISAAFRLIIEGFYEGGMTMTNPGPSLLRLGQKALLRYCVKYA
jgi:hypothetical protein